MSDEFKPADRITSCGDVSCEFLVDPIPRPTPPRIEVRLRPEEREVVLVANPKPGSMDVMRRVHALLQERGIPVRGDIIEKNDSSRALDDQLLDMLASERGLILLGVND
jgi:hypothetical protein